MAKKIFIYYLSLSFLLTTITVQSMAYMSGFSPAGREDQVRLLKTRFKTMQQLIALTLRWKKTGATFPCPELECIKSMVDYNIDQSMLELDDQNYRQYLTIFSEKLKPEGHYENLTKSIIKAMLSPSVGRIEQFKPLKGSTLIGVPVGLVINLFSWIIYGIALLFEDSIPILGLFFYTISVIMTGIGWYFIL